MKNTGEIEQRYAHRLGEPEILFYVKDTDSFLTPRVAQFWNVEQPLWEFALERAGRQRQHWVEFRFASVYEEAAPMEPALRCHSQARGEGGVVKLQMIGSTQHTLAASVGVLMGVYAAAVLLTAKGSVADTYGELHSVLCLAQHGEVVQLFWRDARYVYYTPQRRVRVLERGVFGAAGPYREEPQERRVVHAGQWVCGSSLLMALQCDTPRVSVQAAPAGVAAPLPRRSGRSSGGRLAVAGPSGRGPRPKIALG